MQTFIIYSQIYIALGALYLLFSILPQEYVKRHRAVGALHFQQISVKDKLLECLIYIIALPFAVVGWPFFLASDFWMIYQRISQKKVVRDKIEFGLVKADLKMLPLSVEEIEARERIRDPMGAVADLPFGFLNKKWERRRRWFY